MTEKPKMFDGALVSISMWAVRRPTWWERALMVLPFFRPWVEARTRMSVPMNEEVLKYFNDRYPPSDK